MIGRLKNAVQKVTPADRNRSDSIDACLECGEAPVPAGRRCGECVEQR